MYWTQIYSYFAKIFAPAVKEVNEKNNCQFDYEPVKRGRNVTAITFKYHSKKEQIEQQVMPDLQEPDNEQIYFDETIEEKEINYGGELANLLRNVPCEDEFAAEQIRVLQFVGYADHLKYCNYLSHKVHIMNLYKPKKENRFTYLVKMILKNLKVFKDIYL